LLAVAALIAGPGVALAAKAKDPVKVTSPKNIKGTQKVVIGQFTMGFLIERKDSAKAGGGMLGSGYGGRSTVRSTLAGYSPDDLQAIADAAHDDLVAKLVAAGFEVVDRAGLAAHPAYAKSKAEPGPKEMTTITGRDDKANVLFVSSSQTAPLRLVAGDVVAGGLSAMGMIMNGTQVVGGASTFAKDTGTNVINVIYYVDFADSDEYGGWFRNSSAVSVKGSLALLPDQSKLSVIGPNYKSASLALADPVAVGGDFFDKADSMRGGEKTMNAIGNAIGMLGGVGTNSSKKFTFTARPGTYVPGAKQAAFDANEVLVGRLAALR
jgi:hypothetical protein